MKEKKRETQGEVKRSRERSRERVCVFEGAKQHTQRTRTTVQHRKAEPENKGGKNEEEQPREQGGRRQDTNHPNVRRFLACAHHCPCCRRCTRKMPTNEPNNHHKQQQAPLLSTHRQTHRHTDTQTDTHESDYCGHPFRVSGVFPSTYHQGSAQ